MIQHDVTAATTMSMESCPLVARDYAWPFCMCINAATTSRSHSTELHFATTMNANNTATAVVVAATAAVALRWKGLVLYCECLALDVDVALSLNFPARGPLHSNVERDRLLDIIDIQCEVQHVDEVDCLKTHNL